MPHTSKSLLAVTLILLVLASVAQAAEADALAISANIQKRHMPYGTIIAPWDYEEGSVRELRYTRTADSAIWTGHYLAAEAFRYKVTRSQDALDNVRRTLRGIRLLRETTGNDLLARVVFPSNSPYRAWIVTEEGRHGVFTSSIPVLDSNGNQVIDADGGPVFYEWIGNTSRDQYSGIFFGLGVAYDMVDQADVREMIREDVAGYLDFLLRNNWNIVLPGGGWRNTFNGRTDQQLSFLQVGRRVDPARFGALYDSFRQQNASGVYSPIYWETLDTHGSYFKFNLDYINLYNLVRLEEASSPYLADYMNAYNRLRNATAGHGNAHFNMIDRGVKGANTTRDSETRSLLDLWLTRARLDFTVTNDAALYGGSCGDNRSCSPIPVDKRINTDFLWQRSPFQLSHTGYGEIETSAIDYILPYWMARYYDVLTGPGFAISAAPSSQTIAPGGTANFTVDVSAVDGFSGDVMLSISGLPTGASAAFSPSTVSPSGSSALTVSTDPSTPAGTYTLAVTGTSGPLVRTTTISLTVAKPDFTVSVSPASQTVGRGKSVSYTTAVTPSGGFGGAVSLSVSGLPSGATATFTPTQIAGSGSSVLKVTTRSSTPKGTYTLTVKGTSGGLERTATATLKVT